jgi:hypothetical protein
MMLENGERVDVDRISDLTDQPRGYVAQGTPNILAPGEDIRSEGILSQNIADYLNITRDGEGNIRQQYVPGYIEDQHKMLTEQTGAELVFEGYVNEKGEPRPMKLKANGRTLADAGRRRDRTLRIQRILAED